ncbi:hypothetical protein [Chlamydia sp. 17-3921]|uniref:TmeB family type III secretion system effector n=1 Tax=Chlamydia sp. 17-3921 TaxID=2675798 RepID=UPI00191AF2D0|nr:hypothetical protein [Chlamydia sp. 17-3921]
MGSPISGDDSDPSPITDSFSSEASPSSKEEGDAELDERITESASYAMEKIVDSGIPETTPSESMNRDLLNRIEYEEPQEGVITSILIRIRKSVTKVLRNLFFRKPQKSESFSNKTLTELLETTSLPKTSSTSAYFDSLQTSLVSCRSFFYHIFLRLFTFLRREHPSAPIDLCGTDPSSPEAAVAFALILRSACRWVATIAVKDGCLPLEIIEEAGVYNALSLDSINAIEGISQGITELLYSHTRVDGLANIRGLTKIVCNSSYVGEIQCFSAIENLSQYDISHNYGQIMAMAIRIDEFSKKGDNEALIVKNLLYLIRQDRSKELGNFVMMWSGEYASEVNYDIVTAILETNLPAFEEDFRANPEAYQKKLNYVICQLFCNEELFLIALKE